MKEKLDFPRLETERLIMRMLTHNDVDIAFPHFSNAEVTRYQDEHPVKSADGIKEIIDWGRGLFEQKMGILWGIFSKEDSSFMGQVNYVARPDSNFTRNVHRAELGYDISPQYWGRGFMSEALRSVIAYIFNDTGIDRIEVTIHPDNIRSHEVIMRQGFQKEGVLRQYVLWEGKHWDLVLYSLLKNEWEAVD